MKQNVRVGFVDFWPGYMPENEFIFRALTRYYNVIIDNKKPDFLFYSCCGSEHLSYDKAVKICYYGENLIPNFNICDYSLSCLRDSISGRNLWTPQAIRYNGEEPPAVSDSLFNRHFCNFLYSQESMGKGAQYRKDVCIELMKYRHVDCPGKILHNMESSELATRDSGDWHASKIEFLKQYKFTFAFENTNTDGYMTEKLLDPLIAGSVPIYWGSEGNIDPFNKDCLICASDFSSTEALIERIIEVDTNKELYLSMCAANPLRHKLLGDWMEPLSKFLFKIIEKGVQPLPKDELKMDVIHQFYNDRWIRLYKKCRKMLKLYVG